MAIGRSLLSFSFFFYSSSLFMAWKYASVKSQLDGQWARSSIMVIFDRAYITIESTIKIHS
uniref:Uncharacterized protein n=1 Tax=Rhizophora mucronata TaxID=61149 RepID=A0A2P2R0N2_RHIMU